MRVIDINFEELSKKVRRDSDEHSAEYYKSKEYGLATRHIRGKYYRDFLQHSIPYLASIPIVSNKPSECFRKLKELDYVKVHGEYYSSKQLLAMIVYLTDVNRGDIVVGTMTQGLNAYYGSLTPLVMHAMKEFHGIPYEYWDKTDKFIKYFLTSNTLYNHIFNKPIPVLDNVGELRRLYKDVNAWQSTGFNTLAKIEGCGALVRHMIFQTWLASEDNRTTSMILDPRNWDNIPELFAIPLPKPEEPEEPEDFLGDWKAFRKHVVEHRRNILPKEREEKVSKDYSSLLI